MQFSNLSRVVWTGSNNDYMFMSSPTRLVALMLAFFILQLVPVDDKYKALKSHLKNDQVNNYFNWI